jgi:hypothetical protein
MTNRWVLNVDEDPETGDAIIIFPEDFLEATGWKEGDNLKWTDLGNNSWQLKKQEYDVSEEELLNELEELTREFELIKEDNMAKAKPAVNKIADKLSKVNDSFSVNMYDNGYMLEISGRNSDGDYKSVKIMCSSIAQLHSVIDEATALERDE